MTAEILQVCGSWQLWTIRGAVLLYAGAQMMRLEMRWFNFLYYFDYFNAST